MAGKLTKERNCLLGRKDAYQDEHDHYAFGEGEGQNHHKGGADAARAQDFIYLLAGPRRA
jgi:hypothetical protein